MVARKVPTEQPEIGKDTGHLVEVRHKKDFYCEALSNILIKKWCSLRDSVNHPLFKPTLNDLSSDIPQSRRALFFELSIKPTGLKESHSVAPFKPSTHRLIFRFNSTLPFDSGWTCSLYCSRYDVFRTMWNHSARKVIRFQQARRFKELKNPYRAVSFDLAMIVEGRNLR